MTNKQTMREAALVALCEAYDSENVYAVVDRIFDCVRHVLNRDGRLPLTALQFDELFAGARREADELLEPYGILDFTQAARDVVDVLTEENNDDE
jgi:hypothetical protein